MTSLTVFFPFYQRNVHDWSRLNLLDPEVEGIASWTVAVIAKIKLTIKATISIATCKSSGISLCYTNPMIRPVARTTSSTNHHYSSITTTPVTPEGQVIATLKIAAA